MTAVNDAPVAADVTVTTAEDNAVTINLVATDADNTSAELVFGIQTQPAHGSLEQNADGSFSYQASKDYFGADSFAYRVSDGASEGNASSNLATVSLSIAAVNDAPVASDVTIATLEDNTVTINLVAVDADNTLAKLVFSIQTQPVHGSLVR